jgi:hypothetical protein
MPTNVLRFIQDNELVYETRWPGYVLTISDRGLEYLAQHESQED